MSYRTLDAAKILKTLRTLEQRIVERFPGAGLAAVCSDLIAIGEDTQRDAQAIAAPNWPLRLIVYLAVAAGLAGLGVIAWEINVQLGNARSEEHTSELQSL